MAIKLKASNMIMPHEPTETIDRDKIGDFELGYLTVALKDQRLGFFGINNVSEELLAQTLRDCAIFYWNNRHDIELLEIEHKRSLGDIGEMYYFSRNYPNKGFIGDEDIPKYLKGLLHNNARMTGTIDLDLDDNAKVIEKEQE